MAQKVPSSGTPETRPLELTTGLNKWEVKKTCASLQMQARPRLIIITIEQKMPYLMELIIFRIQTGSEEKLQCLLVVYKQRALL
jgi:hypothetical protein